MLFENMPSAFSSNPTQNTDGLLGNVFRKGRAKRGPWLKRRVILLIKHTYTQSLFGHMSADFSLHPAGDRPD